MAGGTAGAQAIAMVFSPVVTRLYGPEIYGLLGTFLAITSMISPVVALSYPIAIVLPKEDSDAKGIVRLSIYIADHIYWFDDWSKALDGIDVVIHTAASAHIMNDSAADPLAEFRKVNTAGTLKLARQAVAAGVRRFVFISSVKVNGEKTGRQVEGVRRSFSEEDVPEPQDAYAVSKYEAEQGLMAIAEETELEVVIIRPPLVYGPGVKANFRLLMKWVQRGVPLPLGAVHNKRSFVALDNLVNFIIHCMDHPKAANEVFLISDEEDVSTTELLQKMARAFGKRSLLLPVPVGLMTFVAGLLGKRNVADRLFGSLQVDSSKARDLLGWKPVVSMDRALTGVRFGLASVSGEERPENTS
ncbi:NAD-dependent epimerase/dehydratase family protein [Desulfobacula sp.]|uniref:NAD-dependent epimerase/dehydratase family protein n=1 Tax=Desulfobacula sp. TaxID=2593537 RepID=UPI0025BD7F43|nr:NAD-dependent epimerase/dehydratase family protein [Desulfobacula sp.]